VPFVLGSRNRWDRLLAVSVVGLLVAHWLYWSDGIIYGPRFTFEAVAALSLLTARGVVLLARADGIVPDEPEDEIVEPIEPVATAPTPTVVTVRHPAAPYAGAQVPVEEQTPEPAEPLPVRGGSDEPLTQPLSGVPLVFVLVVALFAINLVGYLPQLVPAYRDYNGIGPGGLKTVEAGLAAADAAGLAAADAAGLEPALVFVSSNWPDWQSYGQVFLANGPFLDGNVIYARDLGEAENWRLMNRYAEWRWWLLKDGVLSELRR
jgi:hypothetical protein